LAEDPFGMKMAPAGAIFFFFAVLLLMALAVPGHLLLMLVVAACAASLAYWYFYHVDVARQKWHPAAWQLNVPVEHSEVKPQEVDRIRRILVEEETSILWISHQHVLQL